MSALRKFFLYLGYGFAGVLFAVGLLGMMLSWWYKGDALPLLGVVFAIPLALLASKPWETYAVFRRRMEALKPIRRRAPKIPAHAAAAMAPFDGGEDPLNTLEVDGPPYADPEMNLESYGSYY